MLPVILIYFGLSYIGNLFEQTWTGFYIFIATVVILLYILLVYFFPMAIAASAEQGSVKEFFSWRKIYGYTSIISSSYMKGLFFAVFLMGVVLFIAWVGQALQLNLLILMVIISALNFYVGAVISKVAGFLYLKADHNYKIRQSSALQWSSHSRSLTSLVIAMALLFSVVNFVPHTAHAYTGSGNSNYLNLVDNIEGAQFFIPPDQQQRPPGNQPVYTEQEAAAQHFNQWMQVYVIDKVSNYIPVISTVKDAGNIFVEGYNGNYGKSLINIVKVVAAIKLPMLPVAEFISGMEDMFEAMGFEGVQRAIDDYLVAPAWARIQRDTQRQADAIDQSMSSYEQWRDHNLPTESDSMAGKYTGYISYQGPVFEGMAALGFGDENTSLPVTVEIIERESATSIQIERIAIITFSYHSVLDFDLGQGMQMVLETRGEGILEGPVQTDGSFTAEGTVKATSSQKVNMNIPGAPAMEGIVTTDRATAQGRIVRNNSEVEAKMSFASVPQLKDKWIINASRLRVNQ